MPLPLLVTVAFFCGVLPVFVWLFFWLMEDRCEPEPKRYIVFSFLAGMLMVPLVLPLEQLAQGQLSGVLLFLVWATLEETFKFGAAYIAALRTAAFDEPIDAVIYLVTAALGFSALENAFFLFTPLSQSDLAHTIITEDLRFMGATLLHTLTSATIGIMMALSFKKTAGKRKIFAFFGVVLAIFLHTLFNFFILRQGTGSTVWVFVCVWLGIISILLLTERIKEPKDYC